MSNGNYITNKDLYDAIERLETKLVHRIEKMEACVDENTNWRNKIVGQFAILVIVLGAAINWVFAQLGK